MAIFPIDNLEPGMTLKSAVSDRSGRLLLPAGVELTGKHLNIFRMWGVSEADIAAEGDDKDNNGAAGDHTDNPLMRAEAQLEVEQLFIRNDPLHQMISELMRICVSRRVLGAR
jgi:hypothetical protein